jgi:hypothetical protein
MSDHDKPVVLKAPGMPFRLPGQSPSVPAIGTDAGKGNGSGLQRNIRSGIKKRRAQAAAIGRGRMADELLAITRNLFARIKQLERRAEKTKTRRRANPERKE